MSIGFTYAVQIIGHSSGKLTVSFQGTALETFASNRIGLCVHHSASDCAGLPCLLDHTDGTSSEGYFPTSVSPHQPFQGLAGISYRAVGGEMASFQFEGDVFETEDQRNWTDASFKTYSTPLERPFPVVVASGTTISQSIALRVTAVDAKPPGTPRQGSAQLTPKAACEQSLPSIGHCINNGSWGESAYHARLGELGLAHLRVDIDNSDELAIETLRDVVSFAIRLDAPLEVAIRLPSIDASALASLERAFMDLRPKISRWLLYGPEGLPASRSSLAAARNILGSISPSAPFGTGSNSNFAELNRTARPAKDWTSSRSLRVHKFTRSTIGRLWRQFKVTR